MKPNVCWFKLIVFRATYFTIFLSLFFHKIVHIISSFLFICIWLRSFTLHCNNILEYFFRQNLDKQMSKNNSQIIKMIFTIIINFYIMRFILCSSIMIHCGILKIKKKYDSTLTYSLKIIQTSISGAY